MGRDDILVMFDLELPWSDAIGVDDVEERQTEGLGRKGAQFHERSPR